MILETLSTDRSTDVIRRVAISTRQTCRRAFAGREFSFRTGGTGIQRRFGLGGTAFVTLETDSLTEGPEATVSSWGARYTSIGRFGRPLFTEDTVTFG